MKGYNSMNQNIRWIILLAGITAGTTIGAQAQQVQGQYPDQGQYQNQGRDQGWDHNHGPRHPAYLRAMSELREARHYLNDGWAWEPVRRDEVAAVREIDAAIHEIQIAAIDDGRRFDEPFPIDQHMNPHDRFRKANDLLFAAHNDLARAEEVPEAHGLRDRAIMHVDRAHQIVDHAERSTHWKIIIQ
jgi:hypothetical protein